VKGCKGLGANLGDLGLLEDLSNILKDQRFVISGKIRIGKPLNSEACIIVGKVSHFFSRIEFDESCIPMFYSTEFSKKPLICVSVYNLLANAPLLSN
jgi:hypothetical protein